MTHRRLQLPRRRSSPQGAPRRGMGDFGHKGQATPTFVTLSPWSRDRTAFLLYFGENRTPLTQAATTEAAWKAGLATILLRIMATLGVFCSRSTLTRAEFQGTNLAYTPRALRTTVEWPWRSLLSVGKVAFKTSKVKNRRNQCILEAASGKCYISGLWPRTDAS